MAKWQIPPETKRFILVESYHLTSTVEPAGESEPGVSPTESISFELALNNRNILAIFPPVRPNKAVLAIQFPSLLKIRESSHAAFPPILAVVFQSHADWADVLYRSDSKLTGNIFPSLNPDLDGDGKPDGYDPRVSKLGTAPSDAGLPEKHMLTVEKPGMILRMPGLGGLPHGAAESGCWICGPAVTTRCH